MLLPCGNTNAGKALTLHVTTASNLNLAGTNSDIQHDEMTWSKKVLSETSRYFYHSWFQRARPLESHGQTFWARSPLSGLGIQKHELDDAPWMMNSTCPQATSAWAPSLTSRERIGWQAKRCHASFLESAKAHKEAAHRELAEMMKLTQTCVIITCSSS